MRKLFSEVTLFYAVLLAGVTTLCVAAARGPAATPTFKPPCVEAVLVVPPGGRGECPVGAGVSSWLENEHHLVIVQCLCPIGNQARRP